MLFNIKFKTARTLKAPNIFLSQVSMTRNIDVTEEETSVRLSVCLSVRLSI